MNYRKIYKSLIKRAQIRTLEGYRELHHVIPRCLNGSDDPSNIVALTPEEHYLAHLLLVKIHPHTKGLLYAVKLMSGQGNNKSYGWIKRRISATGFSDEHKANISKSLTGKTKIIAPRTVENLKKLWHKNDIRRQEKKDQVIITAVIYSVT